AAVGGQERTGQGGRVTSYSTLSTVDIVADGRVRQPFNRPEGGQPGLVVAIRLVLLRRVLPSRDPGDQRGPESRPGEHARLMQVGGQAGARLSHGSANTRSPLVRGGSAGPSMSAGRSSRFDLGHGDQSRPGSAVPRTAPRIGARCRLDDRAAPASALRWWRSRTVIRTSSASSSPILNSTVRGSLTMRAR